MREQPEKGNASEGRISEASSVKNQAINQGINMNDSTQANANRAITVPFHGAELYVVEHERQPYTPMKPIITGMGLTWHGQHAKIKANTARWGVLELRIPSTGGLQDMLCMPLRKLPGWLSGIEAGKVRSPEARSAVVRYQDECDDVLWQFWNDGIVINPRQAFAVNPGDKLTKEEAETLRLMLKNAVDRQPKEKQGTLMMQGWSRLKAHFNVSYREIPRHEFSEAVSIIARHTAAWEVVDEMPARQTSVDDAVRLDHAFAIATQTAAKVQRAVFKGIMSSNADWRHGRYLLGMLAGGPDEDVGVELQSVASDACVVPISRFHEVVEDTVQVDAQTLTRLASVCTARLGRMAQCTTA